MSEINLEDARLEQKRRIVREQLSDCSKYTTDHVYFYGNIPDKVWYIAKQNYAGALNREDVLGMISTNLVGKKGKTGLVLAEDGIYYRRMLESAGYIAYQDINTNKNLLSKKLQNDYNISKLNQMIAKIVQVDACTIDEIFNTVNDKIIETDRMFESAKEIVETVQNVLNKWK